MAKTKTVTTKTIRNERQPGGDIPESVMMYIALHPDLFCEYVAHDKDTERIVRMSKKGISLEDAEQVAWLIWRARMVRQWTTDRKTRQPTLTWETAVESAWLKDELFKLCADKRKAYYAEQQARRERLDALVQTGTMDTEYGTKKERKEARRAKKKEEAALDAVKAENNPTDPLPPVEKRLEELAAPQ